MKMEMIKSRSPIVKNNNVKHDKIMNILAKMAVDIIPVGSAKVAACLVIKNQIISFGYNQNKTHPFQAKFGKNNKSIYLHAEIDTIRNSLKYISINEFQKATLYVCRVKFNEHDHEKLIFGLARPCHGSTYGSGCLGAISHFGIKRVVYSTDSGYEEM